jgi:hypothetical protein
MKSGVDRDSMPTALGRCRIIDSRADRHDGSQSLERPKEVSVVFKFKYSTKLPDQIKFQEKKKEEKNYTLQLVYWPFQSM